MVTISINGNAEEIDVDPAMPLLWAVRERLGMTGTKFGCGIAQCGACTMHLDGEPIRSCSTPISAAEGKEVTTIEGIADPDGTLSKVQQAWISEQVPQCGYCQSGQIMSATALLRETPRPTDEQIKAYMSGNICRCGMYGRIRKAIKVAAGIETTTRMDSAEEVSA
ncbi:(2Fe-2S)-binding protein [Pontixanthobacter aestiaquae]|uniref:2Fe-2S iron-sulfur cluster binding domain-containing protein n=1 Tax=Pontixanthobacter aestiaquae TaxID=1509367 RepID=A0A844Z3F9_9SPHN|nr:(2Fe-2S)-binding protein [Pontixanthobacter aestiaquae]MDN3647228.1 (2Fe-2S)-binding protein [Pontixanthobacter aestiaquae]MXO81796.1 2Fe-2S iron-sulfur cluster binding domain-containing protein [Pontixanthobacter aestiaquae]